jgi:hypothetical protein
MMLAEVAAASLVLAKAHPFAVGAAGSERNAQATVFVSLNSRGQPDLCDHLGDDLAVPFGGHFVPLTSANP